MTDDRLDRLAALLRGEPAILTRNNLADLIDQSATEPTPARDVVRESLKEALTRKWTDQSNVEKYLTE